MNIHRVPARYEQPFLYAAVPHDATNESEVIFTFPEGVQLCDDGEHNLYRVWANHATNNITVEAVMWFTDTGLFRLVLSEDNVERAVFAADKASRAVIETCGY